MSAAFTVLRHGAAPHPDAPCSGDGPTHTVGAQGRYCFHGASLKVVMCRRCYTAEAMRLAIAKGRP